MTQRAWFGLRDVCVVMASALLALAPVSVGASSAEAAAAPNGAAANVAGRLAVSVIDPTCQPVLDANHKTLDTPHHLYSEMVTNGKKTTDEMITVNGERYLLMNGKWIKSRMTVAATKAQEEENIKNAKVLSCKRSGDDSVSGEAATVFTEHTETEDTKSDGKIWVSKSRGIILKEEIDLDTGEGDKEHVAMRYEYGNVKAPI
jgi:hypothetical protein